VDNLCLFSVPEFSRNKGIGLAKPSFLISIPANSKNKDLAWKFIEFSNSKEYASHELKDNRSSFGGRLVSYYDDDIKSIYQNICNLEPDSFYSNKGCLSNKESIDRDEFINFNQLSRKLMYDVLLDRLSVNEAITQLQSNFSTNNK
jgi:spermidine/putrescine-binding protein